MIETGRGQGHRLALVWEGEDGQSRFYTYRMLAAEVDLRERAQGSRRS